MSDVECIDGLKCSICRDRITSAEDIVAVACGHFHHLECLENWIQVKHSCPDCGRDIPKENPYQIHDPNHTRELADIDFCIRELQEKQRDNQRIIDYLQNKVDAYFLRKM